MNDMNIAALYRRLTGKQAGHASLDADTLATFAQDPLGAQNKAAVVEALATSPAESRLVRLLRELQPQSDMLAAQIRRSGHNAHPRRTAMPRRNVVTTRRSAHVRVGRWAAVAACLVAVLGVWSWQHSADLRRDAAMTAQTQQNRAAADQLAISRESVASRGDIIFTTRDGIFRSEMDPRVAHGHHSDDNLFSGGFNG